MTIKFDVTVHVHLASLDDVRGLKHSLANLTALTEAVLQATVTDPEKLAQITAQIRAGTATLQAAAQSVSTAT